MKTTYWMQPQYLKPRQHTAPISWGSVFAGTLVGLASQIMLTLFLISTSGGAADGFMAHRSGLAHEFPWSAMLWAATMLLPSAICGYTAARFSGRRRITDGTLYGLITWALYTLMVTLLTTSNIAPLFDGIVLTNIAFTDSDAWWALMTVAASLLLSVIGGILATTRSRLGTSDRIVQ